VNRDVVGMERHPLMAESQDRLGSDLIEELADEALIDQGRPADRSLAAQWVTATGADAYRGAFFKLLADPERGHLLWTPEEGDAFRAVSEVQSSMRAMSLTDNAGGFMVPLTLDPSIILTSDGSINPLRRVSRVVQTTSDTWQGVSSAGVTAEWTTEGTQMADATPTLAGPSSPVYKGDAFVPYSFEVGHDALNFQQELTKLLVDGADQLMATAYTTGTGSNQPTGIITALDGGSSEVSPASAETFAAADVFSVLEAVPPRFRANATWQANLSVINLIHQFETSNGARMFPELDNDRLLRRPLNENSNMDGSWDTGATADNFILLAGDFSNFVIVDRIGTTIELAPHLFGANGRPNGQRGLIMWFRTGSDSVNDSAFALLNLATTA
jgi:HK97 family phage major capsid protein